MNGSQSPAGLSPILEEQLVSLAIQPESLITLLRIYNRGVLRLLGRRAAVNSAGLRPAEPMSWLHPRVVWQARYGLEHGSVSISEPLPAADGSPHQSYPAQEHVAAGAGDAWIAWAVSNLQTYAGSVDGGIRLRLASMPIEQLRAPVDDATAILWRVWPGALLENQILIRAFVYIEGGDFRSATFEDILGAAMVGTGSVSSVAAAFEMMLHEGGHHSLFLRNKFAEFVSNGTELAAHPLRPDPRPIKGVLHAAHVLARMATGLSYWCRDSGAPAEAVERRDDAISKLRATLAVLQDRAAWTLPGAAYFENLKRLEVVRMNV